MGDATFSYWHITGIWLGIFKKQPKRMKCLFVFGCFFFIISKWKGGDLRQFYINRLEH